MALVSQAAYLESLKDFLKQDNNLLNRIGQTAASDEIQQKIKQLEEIEISDEEGKKAVTCFHESRLATIYGKVLLERLKQAGLTETEADLLTERVTWNTHRYMILAWAESGDAVKHLAQPSFADWREEQEKYQSLENYLTEQISTKPLETVFAEEFTFQDIYIPLKAKPVDLNGEVEEWVTPFNLETWAKETIIDPKKQGKVLFIQGGPGRGKSVFCRMFANWVRQQLYPIWIPVLIRLRDIPKLQPSFRETLREAVNANFASEDGWLTDRNTRYLFFLDGFDELIIEGRNSSGLEQFLKQVGQFQKDSTGKDMGHRVIVTGRTLALQGVERQMPDNLERVRIEVMDEPLQQEWLSRWEKQVGTEKKNAFAEFLQDRRCPEQVQELAREPLLLYLLAAMHRDGKLNLEAFQDTNETQAKLVIYEESLNWVLTEQRKPVQTHITGLETEDLRCILMEAGLCVVQSGGEYAKVKMIEERLDKGIVAAIEQARTQAGENVLKNALAAFYLKPAAGDQDGGVEFFHKSFSEFLCAKRLQESLIAWTEPGRRGRGYNLKEEQLWEEIYDLLGYGGLTLEIVEYLMGLLRESKEFSPVKLFERLEDFYFLWSDGEFIDSPSETLPQRKCQKLQQQNIELGQRQVDVYAGLNVMILLFELHRYGQRPQNSRPPNPQNWGLREVGDFNSGSPQSWGARGALVFHPCGQLDDEGELEDEFRLYRIIGYSRCVEEFGFVQKVGQFLRGTNLKRADLKRTDLRGANLRGTDLRDANLRGTYLRDTELDGTDLSGTYLSNANLRSANLRSANLSGADLSGADLSNTNLTGTNLRSANLSSANLSRADLRGANFSGVNLTGADFTDANLSDTNLIGAYQASQTFGEVKWDENTNWENVRGLETAINVPEALKRQLGLE